MENKDVKKVKNKANSDASNIIRHADMYVHSVYELWKIYMYQCFIFINGKWSGF